MIKGLLDYTQCKPSSVVLSGKGMLLKCLASSVCETMGFKRVGMSIDESVAYGLTLCLSEMIQSHSDDDHCNRMNMFFETIHETNVGLMSNKNELPCEVPTDSSSELPCEVTTNSNNTKVPCNVITNFNNTKVPCNVTTNFNNTKVPCNVTTNFNNTKVPCNVTTNFNNTKVPCNVTTSSNNTKVPCNVTTDSSSELPCEVTTNSNNTKVPCEVPTDSITIKRSYEVPTDSMTNKPSCNVDLLVSEDEYCNLCIIEDESNPSSHEAANVALSGETLGEVKENGFDVTAIPSFSFDTATPIPQKRFRVDEKRMYDISVGIRRQPSTDRRVILPRNQDLPYKKTMEWFFIEGKEPQLLLFEGNSPFMKNNTCIRHTVLKRDDDHPSNKKHKFLLTLDVDKEGFITTSYNWADGEKKPIQVIRDDILKFVD